MNYLLSAVERVRGWTDEEYGQNLGVFLDEQPMLFSWLIRLSEEFDDDVPLVTKGHDGCGGHVGWSLSVW